MDSAGWRISAACGLLLAFLACSADEATEQTVRGGVPQGAPNSASATIGDAGGSLELLASYGSVTMVVPEAALDGTRTFTIRELHQKRPGGLGPIFDLGPSGEYARPIPVSITPDPSWRLPLLPAIAVATWANEGWEKLDDQRREGSTYTADTRHFSEFTLVLDDDGARLSAMEVDIGEDETAIAERILHVDSSGNDYGSGEWIERHYHYDDAGRLTRIDRVEGAELVTESNTTFDGLGRPIQLETEEGLIVEWSWDDVGDLASVTRRSADGGWSETTTVAERDPFGRPTVVIDPAGAIFETGYDHDGYIAFTIGPDGRRTDWVRNAAGEVIEIRQADGTRILYERDELGRSIGMIAENGQRTRWTWNDVDREQTVDFPGPFAITYHHDERGILEEISGTDGRTTALNYDTSGRVVERTVTEGAAEVELSFTYDGLGRRAARLRNRRALPVSPKSVRV